MSTQKPAETGPKELDLTGAFEWDNSDALTRLIPTSAAPTPPSERAPAWRPPPSSAPLAPSHRPAIARPVTARAAPPPPPPPPPVQARPSAAPAPPPVQTRPAAATAAPPPPPPKAAAAATPPKLEPKEPITAFLPPQQMQNAVASLPAPVAAPAKPRVSMVRMASYALALLLAAGFGLKALQGSRARAPRAAASALQAANGPTTAPGPIAAKARPLIETRALEAPSVKEAATAFARGDYREALAHYRLLAQQNPQQQAFKSLVTILERRLAPKSPAP